MARERFELASRLGDTGSRAQRLITREEGKLLSVQNRVRRLANLRGPG